MRREAITDEELDAKLRENGASSLEEVERIYLELDGQISVVKKK
nr:YetF domain-containing protein [Paraburkholderia sp. BL8N3]